MAQDAESWLIMLRIRNWDEFQHFKDRTPPWIKLYRYILDDPEWHSLSGDDSKVLVMLWLIASEDKAMEGNLPNMKTLAFRLRLDENVLNQAITRLSHWLIQDDINVISICHQPDAPEESRDRVETEKKSRKRDTLIPDDFCVSERVKNWAIEKGYSSLNVHLDNFIMTSKAKGYKYVDWDMAFMKAISSNWANVATPTKRGLSL